MKKGLLRFGVAVLVVLCSVAVIDFAIGKMMDWMLPQISNQGETGKTYFSLYDVNTPVVIAGSSRSAHHYETQQVEDSLGLPTYNVSRDGCFFSHNSCVINTIMDRYSPKLIIWENRTEYLAESESDPFVNLYPYYGSNEWVTTAIEEELPWTEYARLNSNIYKFNSIIHRVLTRFRSRNSFEGDPLKGYEPLAPRKLVKRLELTEELKDATKVSETREKRFRAVLARAKEKGIKMIITDSPSYTIRRFENASKARMAEICKEYDVLFIDNTQDPYFLEHPELFDDRSHLNSDGAKKYTEMFLNQIHDYVSSIKK